MDEIDKVAIATARTDSAAAASVAIAGIAGLYHELSLAGLLDDEQLQRLRAFLLISVEKSGASRSLRDHMTDLISQNFSEIRDRMS